MIKNFFTQSDELNSTKRKKLARSIGVAASSDLGIQIKEYLYLTLESKINLLLNASGEEAIALRGELKNIKHLISVLEKGDTPLADSI